MKKNLTVLVAGLMLAAMLTGCGAKKTEENYVATVDKYKITEKEYTYFLMDTKNKIEQMTYIQDEADKKELWEGTLGDKPAQEYAKELALDSAREFKLLLEAAKSAGYKANEEEVKNTNAELDELVASLGQGQEGVIAFEKKYGLSVDQVKAMSDDFNIIQNYYKGEIEKTKFTDEEIKQYYEENKEEYGDQVTVKHVLFMTVDQTTREPLSQEKQDEAKKKAEDILARVKAGEDIGELAKQYTEDTGSKDNGGEYTFGKGQMVKEFEDWSFSAKVGDVGLVKTEYGYHVIKLEKTGLDAVKSLINSKLIENKFSELIEQWVKDPKNEIIKNQAVYDSIKVYTPEETQEITEQK
ncbi:peptidylprolyl isomerase [Clostridium thermarum]|uniref:peptidylprolyl isomerase n=1 Tax=Clostridium thermarum TaxID=1716543 RepID=UPI0013CF9A80|nr:peptidylprolyl isomerase [Clostridium thermarum]